MAKQSIFEQFYDYIDHPDAAGYLELRERIMKSDSYNPNSKEFDGVSKLLKEERFQEAKDQLDSSLPNLLLSARAHQLQAEAAKSSDEDGASVSEKAAKACAEGLLATGDGTAERPYLPLRASDQRDLVKHLGKKYVSQTQARRHERVFDVVECADGAMLWFDMTEPCNTQPKRSIFDLFYEDFLAEPNAANYLAVRQRILNSDNYDPDSQELAGIHQLLEEGRPEDARNQLDSQVPNLLLSSRAHLLTAMTWEHEGDRDRAESSESCAKACLEGLLATGDGTPERPYLPVRPSDQQDLLMLLEKEYGGQRLVRRDERVLDAVECADGMILWFDMTEPYSIRTSDEAREADVGEDEEYDDDNDDTLAAHRERQFRAFVEHPDAAGYLALRAELLKSEFYDSTISTTLAIAKLLEEGRVQDAVSKLDHETRHNLRLSPFAYLLTLDAWASNDEARAEYAKQCYFACLKGMVATGDGTREWPYLPAHAEYKRDLASYLSKKSIAPARIVNDGERLLEALDCTDGTTLWFDLTEPYSRLPEEDDEDDEPENEQPQDQQPQQSVGGPGRWSCEGALLPSLIPNPAYNDEENKRPYPEADWAPGRRNKLAVLARRDGLYLATVDAEGEACLRGFESMEAGMQWIAANWSLLSAEDREALTGSKNDPSAATVREVAGQACIDLLRISRLQSLLLHAVADGQPRDVKYGISGISFWGSFEGTAWIQCRNDGTESFFWTAESVEGDGQVAEIPIRARTNKSVDAFVNGRWRRWRLR